MDIADPIAGQLHVKDEIGLRCQKLFQDFLEEFSEDGELKYLQQIVELTSPDRSTLEVNFDDVERYNQNLATTIIEEYYRIYPYLCQVVSNVTKDRTELKVRKDCFVSFTDVPTRHKVRDLTTAKIGTLIRISGQVVRTHAIHPELMFGTFSCGSCQTEIRDVEQQFKYTQPVICRNPVCANRKQFILNVDKSRFVDFQRVRIQETQAELQRGCIPRSVDVVLRAESVETVQAGDRCDFTGTIIVLPDIAVLQYPGAKIDIGASRKHGDNAAIEGIRGLKALGVRDLNYRMAFLACNVEATTSRFGGTDLPISEITAEDIKKQMSEQEWNKVYEMSRDRNLYTNLINSLFPSIYGCDELKRGVLLQLFSGVAKTTYEQTSLRGDINVCIVGDPSTAKSQLLKQVSEFTPRAIYTSGKASSAAGLTAAVVRDEETGDFVIEAGALMLADNGICCIDEFDKMDERDQVAIHEAMEQQTITIAKAGVRATLNARTSVLAAANPINGRYDRKKSLQQNIHLSAPIMSRFDLFFVLVDECNEVVDYAIARKIVDLHSNIQNSVEQMYTREEVLRYITFARQFKPMISDEAMELLIQNYTNLRQRDSLIGGKGTWRITVRQLESMVRLSEAMAKMECCNDVQVKHVNEAYRLLNKSIIRIEQPDIHFDDDDDDGEMGDAAGLTALMDIENHGGGGADDSRTSADNDVVDTNNLQKKKLTLSFEEYKNVSNMLILRLRRTEEEIGGGGSGSDAMMQIDDQDSESIPSGSQPATTASLTGADGGGGGGGGMKRSDLINWYLEEVSDQIETETELIEYKTLVEKIIDRLIYHDQVILILRSSELKTSTKSQRSHRTDDDDDADADDDQILVVHPSYSLE